MDVCAWPHLLSYCAPAHFGHFANGCLSQRLCSESITTRLLALHSEPLLTML